MNIRTVNDQLDVLMNRLGRNRPCLPVKLLAKISFLPFGFFRQGFRVDLMIDRSAVIPGIRAASCFIGILGTVGCAWIAIGGLLKSDCIFDRIIVVLMVCFVYVPPCPDLESVRCSFFFSFSSSVMRACNPCLASASSRILISSISVVIL